MASPIRRPARSLTQQLLDEPWKFDFFQAVRILHLVAFEKSTASSSRSCRSVGEQWSPDDEILRFRAEISFGFPSAEISRASFIESDTDESSGVFELETTFMALAGTSGVLPHHYTQRILDRERRNDYALRRFLDSFHHRIVSLFYRAWEKHRFPFAWEKSQFDPAQNSEDLFTQAIYSFVGLGTDTLNPTRRVSSVIRDRLQIPDETFLYYAGLFSHTPRNSISLQRMLAEQFSIEVDVVQFQGQWLTLDPTDQSQMSTASLPSGVNCELGTTAFLGARVRDVQGRIRIRLGPLSYADFKRFSPGSTDFVRLSQLVRAWVGIEFDVDIQPLLNGKEIPMATAGNSQESSRLGWNSWVRNDEMSGLVGDTVFEIDDHHMAGT